MKKLLFIALLLIPSIVSSQTAKSIDGFLGIKFGTNRAAVIAALQAKGGKINKESSTAHSLAMDHIKLGHRKTCVFVVKFINNKAYEADFCFRPDMEDQLIEEYKSIIDGITQVYGTGTATNNYTAPYQEGDGNTITGISTGNVDMHTLWQSQNSNTIYVNIMTQMVIKVTYQDYNLADQAVAQQKSKDAADY